TIPDSSTVLLGQLGLSSADYFLISPTGESITETSSYANNVYGYATGIEAASGPTAEDYIIIVTGGGAHLYTGTLEYIVDLSINYPSHGYAQGVAFSPDGSRLFFLDSQNEEVVVVDVDYLLVIGSLSVPGANFKTLKWGEEIVVAADGEGFYYNTT